MKRPIAIWLTDTHLSENTVEINKSVFSQVFSLCKQLQINTILHGGDVFTSRKGQPEIVLNTFKEIIDDASKQQLKILAIAGNHDRTQGDSEESFLDAFDGHDAFDVFGAGGEIKVGNICFYFLPYFDLTYQSKLQAIRVSNNVSDFCILLTHTAIDGVRGNNGIEVKDELSVKLFDKFDLTLVGHYHDRQFIGTNIVYTGSAYQATFGEDANKGCTIIYDDGSVEFIELNFPQYLTIDIIPDQDLNGDFIRKVKDKSSEARIRLRMKGEIGEDKKALLIELQSLGVKIENEKQSFTPHQIDQGQVSFDSTDILQMYDQWSEDRKIDNKEFGKKLLTKFL